MFLGTYQPKLDDKGRLFLPSRFREQLAEGIVITKGQDRCLLVLPRADFAAEGQRLRQASLSDKAVRDYSRILFAGAFDQVPDSQGRITVPPKLREYAGLVKDCVVLGNNTRVEIWDEAAWDAYEAAGEQQFSEQTVEVIPASRSGTF